MTLQLTTSGVAIGIAAIVAVLGISASSKADLLAQLDALGTNLLTVTPGQSFCDVVDSCSYPNHVLIGKEPGHWLTVGTASACAVACSSR